MRSAQSPVEFIIVVFLFMIILISIFTAFLTKLHPEIEKAIEQRACLKASGLATFLLSEPGTPADWQSSELQLLGLTNGTSRYISYDKWLAAGSMGYLNIRNKTVPDTSYLIGYNIYAFNPTVADDVCPITGNGAVICRDGAGSITVTASPASPAIFNLKLFFPYSTATVTPASLEASDSAAAATTASGTTVTARLNTSATDSDQFSIAFTASPKLAFIQTADYKTTGAADLQILIGNTSAVETIGSASTGVNNYCKSERAAGLVGKINEVFPVRFSALAW